MRTRLLRYALVGLASTAAYFLGVAGLVEVLRLDPVASAVLAYGGVIALAYVLNRRWVFASLRAHRSALPRFLAATAFTLLLNVAIMHVVVKVLGGWYGVGLVVTTAVVPPTNYLLNHYWCFRAPA